VALSNPDSSDKNAVKGYIKLSVSVQGPGDNSIRLTDSSGEKFESKEVMMPASIKKDYK